MTDETKELERLRKELDEAREGHNSLFLGDFQRACNEREAEKARAEQAEREREDTLRMWREYKAAKDADVASADAARERAESVLADALRFNNEGQQAAHAAEVDAAGLASLLQDSEAMRRALRARAERAEGQQRSDFAKMQAWRERCERAEADNAARLAAFSDPEVQWARKSDWQGLCPFRSTHGCDGTDGRVSAMGTPRPKPHGEHCPFRLLSEPHPGAALLERLRALERSVAAPLAAISEEEVQALREACRAQHKAGVGGQAICACGQGGGGTPACSALRELDEARMHALDLLAGTTPGAAETTGEYVRALEKVRDVARRYVEAFNDVDNQYEVEVKPLQFACDEADALRGKA